MASASLLYDLLMKPDEKVQVPWVEIDTLLLDMDGTLLDLAFDNFFWLELVPLKFAELHGLDAVAAQQEIEQRYAQVVGTLPWYCVDHWTRELGLDIRALKSAHSHRIRYLPEATRFLEHVRKLGKRLILVTNAHRASFAIKAAATGIDRWMDTVVSSHDYAQPKESPAFWRELYGNHAIDPARAMLIEDSLAVLQTAKKSGIAHVVAIRHPDTSQAQREIEDFSAVDRVADLI